MEMTLLLHGLPAAGGKWISKLRKWLKSFCLLEAQFQSPTVYGPLSSVEDHTKALYRV